MSCKTLKLNSCEILGSTFAGRTFNFPDRNISQDKFTAKVKGFAVTNANEVITGVVAGKSVFFSKDSLSNLKSGRYVIEYWADFKDIANEMIALEEFLISNTPCACTDDSLVHDFTLEFPTETIEYSVDIAIINRENGKSAYEIAVENGFVGTESEWLVSLKGEKGEKGGDFEYSDFTPEQLLGLKGESFKYEDFTPEQITELQYPATQAAENLTTLIDEASDKIIETEIARQSSITATNNANNATSLANTAAVAANTAAQNALSGIKGIATQSNAPTAYTPETYPNGLFESYKVTAPITSPNSWGNIAVTQAELDANYVYFDVKNGVVTKHLSLKPIQSAESVVNPTGTKAVSGKAVVDYLDKNYKIVKSGMNLFDENNIVNNYSLSGGNDLTPTLNAKTTDLIKLTRKDKVSVFIKNTGNNHRLGFFDINGVKIGTAITSPYPFNGIAVPLGAEFIRLYFKAPADPDSVINEIYITETNDVIPYADNSKLISIAGVNNNDVKFIIGDNIFNGELLSDIRLSQTGDTTILTAAKTSKIIPLIKRNGLLSVSINGSSTRYLVFLDENKDKIFSSVISFVGNLSGIVVPSTAYYVQIYCKNPSETDSNALSMMVSETATAIPFKPYEKTLKSVDGAEVPTVVNNGNSGVSKISIKNENPNFNFTDSNADGLADGFTADSGITDITNNLGVQSFKVTTAAKYLKLQININANDKYYLFCKIKNIYNVGNGNFLPNYLVDGEYLSFYSYGSNLTNFIFGAYALNEISEISKFSLINLTKIFGAGKEPTREEFAFILNKFNGKIYVENEIFVDSLQDLQMAIQEYKNKYSIEIKSIPYITNSAVSKGAYPTMFGVKMNNEKDGDPFPVGWLYYTQDSSNDILYSEGVPDNPKKIFSWNKAITPNGNQTPMSYQPIICKNGDIIFVFRTEVNQSIPRANPIIYKASENYTTPHIIDFGGNLKPTAWLGSSGMTLDFKNNIIYIAEYTRAWSTSANVWKVTAPFDIPENWGIVLTQEIGTDIEHFHTAQIDQYTGDLYITSGDSDSECKWWRSTDKGVTFDLLSSNSSRYRVLNFIFTKEFAIYATDSTSHSIGIIPRGVNGKLDFSKFETIRLINDFSPTQVTYATLLSTKPYGILMIDNIDANLDVSLDVNFFDLKTRVLHRLDTFTQINDGVITGMGFRHEAVNFYQSPTSDRFVVGFGYKPNVLKLNGNSRLSKLDSLCNLTLKVNEK